MTEINIPLLRKAVEWVEEQDAKPYENRQWHQSQWRTPAKVAASVYGKAADCGTCYCVAGYVAELVGTEWNTVNWVQSTDGRLAHDIAAEALGLTATGRLFDGDNTAADVRRIAEDLTGEKL